MKTTSKFKTTNPVPLPYRGAPLGVHDLVMQQVRFEDQFFPHHQVVHSEEVMKKQLPSSKWTPAAKHVFGNNIIRFALALMP